MKDRRTWGVLLVLWVLLLGVQLLSYGGVLPFGRVHEGFLLVSAVGIGSCIWNLFHRD